MMKFYRNTLISLSILSAGSMSLAQATQPTSRLTAQLVENESIGAKLIFSDGREAGLLVTDRTTLDLHFKMEMIENTCADKGAIPVHCELTLPTKADVIAYVWTKNSNPQKIGVPIKVKSLYQGMDQGSFESFSSSTFSTWYSNRFQPLTQQKLSHETVRLKCNDFSWLTPPNSKIARIELWSGENMTQNYDTKVTENSADTSVENISLERHNDIFVVKSYEALASTGFIAQIPVFGNVNNIVYKKQDQLCQASFSIDISDIVKQAAPLQDIYHQTYKTPYLGIKSASYQNSFNYLHYIFADQNSNSSFLGLEAE